MKIRRIAASVATGLTSILVLTGCVNISMDVAIHDDSTASIETRIGYEKQAVLEGMMSMGQNSTTPNESEICAAIREGSGTEMTGSGFAITEWIETETECILSAKSPTVEYNENGLVLSAEQRADNMLMTLNIVKVGDKAEFSYDLEGFLDSEAASFGMISSFSISVSFPGEISTANHATIEKNKATWNLEALIQAAEQDGKLVAVGSLSSFNLMTVLLIVAVVVFILLVVGAIIFVLMRRKHHSPHETGTNGSENDDITEPIEMITPEPKLPFTPQNRTVLDDTPTDSDVGEEPR